MTGENTSAANGDGLPRALPAWAYHNDRLAALEYERVFVPSWQILCHRNSIPQTGDYVTLNVGPDSILGVRGRDGKIRAFHNVCRHRAAQILGDSGNCQASIRCPYHGWAYDLEGRLRGVPEADSFPGLDRDQHGLKPVATQELLGFIFVNISGDNPVNLTDLWAPFLAELAPYRIEDMQPMAPIFEEHWDVDWKVTMDNYLESYHVPVGHPGLNRMFTADYIGQVRLPTGIACGTGQFKEQPSSKWGERAYQKLAPTVADHLPDGHRRRWRYISVLPNLGVDIFPDQMDFFQVLPRGPGKCTIRMANFALPDDRREMRLLRYLNSRINRLVQREDETLCQRVQRGLNSRGYTPGPLSSFESCVLQFHDMLHQRIPEIRSPAPPQAF